MLNWTWDPVKNRENLQKHGIRFENAIRIFDDLFVVINEDPYPYEQRWQATGAVRNTIITAVYTLPPGHPDDDNQLGRIISARKATRYERRDYEESQTGIDRSRDGGT